VKVAGKEVDEKMLGLVEEDWSNSEQNHHNYEIQTKGAGHLRGCYPISMIVEMTRG
jgi:hypothetical protein